MKKLHFGMPGKPSREFDVRVDSKGVWLEEPSIGFLSLLPLYLLMPEDLIFVLDGEILSKETFPWLPHKGVVIINVDRTEARWFADASNPNIAPGKKLFLHYPEDRAEVFRFLDKEQEK